MDLRIMVFNELVYVVFVLLLVIFWNVWIFWYLSEQYLGEFQLLYDYSVDFIGDMGWEYQCIFNS